MAQRAIHEFHAKQLFSQFLQHEGMEKLFQQKSILLTPETDPTQLPQTYPWLLTDKLICKPDQLIGKRGNNNLILLNGTFSDVEKFLQEKQNKEVMMGKTTGVLTHFLIEPFYPHGSEEEVYISIQAERTHDKILFSAQGGVDIEAHWDALNTLEIPTGSTMSPSELIETAMQTWNHRGRPELSTFIKALYAFFVAYDFTSLEINPLMVKDENCTPLDMKGKVDDTASFLQKSHWGDLPFPASFGLHLSPEETYIKSLDAKTGSSLKLTVLNPTGRIWTLVAGGGASVIYADTICDLGYTQDLANYGEYSGDPKADETYEYTKTILNLMTREKDPQGRNKILLIGGGIANFTDVAKTFTGIIKALTEYKDKLIATGVKIYVRRGGPNYQEGLRNMKTLGEALGVPLEVYGPETHMTKIVSLALAS